MSESLEQVYHALSQECDAGTRAALAASAPSLQGVRDALIRNSAPLSEATLRLCDALELPSAPRMELPRVVATSARAAIASPNIATRLLVWRGDITSLAVDAVVNACNSAGLGCFQVGHRCIDNVIHSAAGPRLRESCRALLGAREADLGAGEAPIVTPGFRLHARNVVHVTGPQLPPSRHQANERERELLRFAYWASLDACVEHGLRSIAFNCLSTGVFRFPGAEAAQIALRTAREWIEAHPAALDYVIFDVFTQQDLAHYERLFPLEFKTSFELVAAADAFQRAERVLVVAAAGMSAYLDPAQPYNVYVNEEHFARAYPDMVARGYKTGYQTMGLYGSDQPDTVKWGFQIRHMQNMGHVWPPNEGYGQLLQMLQGKEFFVSTSNVDQCFERAGFPDVYTPQGQWWYYQCQEPCRRDSVWPTAALIKELLPLVDPVTGELPPDAVPKCRNCGGRVMGNVRGGDWFLHTPYEEDQAKLVRFIESNADGKPFAILEVGCGFNTPTVTRFQSESVALEYPNSTLIRVNPSDSDAGDVPSSIGIAAGWECLTSLRNRYDASIVEEAKSYVSSRKVRPFAPLFAQRYGHFDWRRFLASLAR